MEEIEEKKRPKVGLALSSGAARGLSYIGVLKVLEKEHIPIDFIAGSSIGALIGAAYAAGISARELEQKIFQLSWQDLVDFTIPRKGLIKGKKIEAWIGELLQNKSFEQLKIPLAVVATDLTTGSEVVFNSGDVARAVRASISMPGVFEPARVGGMVLADGGLVNPLPIDITRKIGADIVIAVDISIHAKKARFTSARKREEFARIIGLEYFTNLSRQVEQKVLMKRRRFYPILKTVAGFLFRTILQPHKVVDFVVNREIPEIVMIIDSANTIMINELVRKKLGEGVDVVIRPDLKMAFVEFGKAKYCIRKGEAAARAALPRIRGLLGK